MDKLKMHTPDLTQENIEKLAALFPNCVTETLDDNGQIKRAIDFDQLRQELSDHVVEGPRERYHLDWPGKREALLAANAPIAKTLRPCRDESVDFDTTKNIFIEGDNLDVLKLLQETYLGKVKLIYIDPPYNTGSDFIYDDDFVSDTAAYLVRSRQIDDSGSRMIATSESNGRFHSDWLSMIFPRLKLARNLLSDDGAIFISIDDGELTALKIVCDEVFGSMNYCGVVSRATGTRMGDGDRALASELDYILVYSKSDKTIFAGLPMTKEEAAIYDQQDARGKYLIRSLRRTGGENRREDRPTMFYPLTAPDGTQVYPIAPAGYESRWVCGKETYKKLQEADLIEWKKMPKDGEERWQVYQKHYLGSGEKQPSNLWIEEDGNKKATKEVNALFEGSKVFDHPKPLGLLQRIINMATESDKGHIVIDFFAGSGTTGHAVWVQNIVDGGNRRFVLVQLPELLSLEMKAQQVAVKLCDDLGLPRAVSEVTKERLRRAAKGFGAEGIRQRTMELGGNSLSGSAIRDTGFRVLKIDTSSMKDVYYAPDAVKQDQLELHTDNIKEDRAPEDLLFQVLVDWGVDLALPIEQQQIAGKTVFFVDGNALAACFDPDISEDLVKALAKKKPLRAVFRDSSYASDSTKINVEQIFKLLSPATEVKSL
jgi:adenine-specific DNA-methyltransferase